MAVSKTTTYIKLWKNPLSLGLIVAPKGLEDIKVTSEQMENKKTAEAIKGALTSGLIKAK